MSKQVRLDLVTESDGSTQGLFPKSSQRKACGSYPYALAFAALAERFPFSLSPFTPLCQTLDNSVARGVYSFLANERLRSRVFLA